MSDSVTSDTRSQPGEGVGVHTARHKRFISLIQAYLGLLGIAAQVGGWGEAGG